MGVQGILANTSAMDKDGRSTVECSEALGVELNDLKTNVDNLMAIWKGDAASSFEASYTEQNKNFDAFKVLLNDLGEGVSVAANILNETEEDNTQQGKHLFG